MRPAALSGEESAALVLDGIGDGVIAVDRSLRIVYANAAALRVLGTAHRAPLGLRLPDLFPRFRGSNFEHAFEHVLTTGEPHAAENYSQSLGAWVACRFSRSGDRIIGVFHDVTAQRRAREFERGQARLLAGIAVGDPLAVTLERTTQLYEQQFQGAIASILRHDPATGRLFGGIAPSLPAAYHAAIEGALAGPAAGSCGTAAYRRQRVVVEDIATDPLWSEYRELALPLGLRSCWSEPVFGSDGAVLGTFAIYYREPRRPGPAELELIERAATIVGIALTNDAVRRRLEVSEQRFRSLFDRHPSAAFAMTLAGVVTECNEAALALSGFARDAMLGHSYESMIDEPERAKVAAEFKSAVAGVPRDYETVGVRADGERRIVHVTNLPIIVDGSISGVFGIATDITEEARRRDHERALRQVIEQSPAVLWRFRPGGRAGIDFVSANVARFGYRPEQFTSGEIDFADLLHPDDAARLHELWRRSAAEGADRIECVYRMRDAAGDWVWLDERTAIERAPDGSVRSYLGITLDVTERELARERLAQRDRFFALAPLVFCITDGKGHYQQVNRSYCELLGRNEAELLATPIVELIHPDDRSRAEHAKQRLVAEGAVFELPLRMLRSDGRICHIEWRGMRTSDGQMYVTGRDISAQRRAEGETSLLREAIEQSPAVLWRWHWDDAWSVAYVSRNVRQWGYEPDAFGQAGLTYKDIVHPDDREALRLQFHEVAAGRRDRVEAVYRLRTGGGDWVWVDERSTPVRDGRGAIEYWQGLTIDATAREETRLRLAERDRFFDLSQEVFSISGPDGRRRQVNAAMARVLGYSAEELMARPWHEFIHPDDRDELLRNPLQVVRWGTADAGSTDISKPRDVKYLAKDGSTRVLSIVGVRDENGYVHMAGRDVTDLVRVQEEQRVLRRVIEGSPVVLWRWRGDDLAGVAYVSANVRQWGYEPEEFTSGARGFESVVHPEDAPAAYAAVLAAIADGATSFEQLYRVVTRDGRSIWVDDRTTIARDATGRVAYLEGVTIDVTAREEARARLAQRDRFFDLSLEVFMIGARDGGIRQASPSFHRLLGLGEQELLSRNWRALVHPDDWDATRALYVSFAQGQSAENFRVRMLHADGSHRWVEWSGTLAADGNVYATGRDVTQAVAVSNALRAALDDLSKRNRELEDFAHVASHDLQEPLRKIRMFADRLALTHGAELAGAGASYLGRIDGAATRMQELIDGLLLYSRVNLGAVTLAPVELDAVAAEVLGDLEAAIEQAGARVEIGALPSVVADRTQMRQVFQNLIGNALKFVPAGRAPVVRVSGTLLSEAQAPDGRARVRLVFADNGIGFEPSQATRIFAPFARLHDRQTYAGTGIGLSIVRRIVERHGGDIRASAVPGQGAEFVLEWPLLVPDGQGHAGLRASTTLDGKGATT